MQGKIAETKICAHGKVKKKILMQNKCDFLFRKLTRISLIKYYPFIVKSKLKFLIMICNCYSEKMRTLKAKCKFM